MVLENHCIKSFRFCFGAEQLNFYTDPEFKKKIQL